MSVDMWNCHSWPLDVSNNLSGYFMSNSVLVTSCSCGGAFFSLPVSKACLLYRGGSICLWLSWTTLNSEEVTLWSGRFDWGAICLWYLYVYICTGISLYLLISWLFRMGSHWSHWTVKSSLSALAVSNGREGVGSIVSFTRVNLKIWAHLLFYALLHRRSFRITYERANNLHWTVLKYSRLWQWMLSNYFSVFFYVETGDEWQFS